MSKLDFEMTDRVLSEELLFDPLQSLVENANVTAYMRAKGFSSQQELSESSIKNTENPGRSL